MLSVSEITKKLELQKVHFKQKYGVKEMALFVSFARNEQTGSSDLDIIVDFNRNIGIEFIDLADELEALLKIKIDLVSKNAIKKNMFKLIEKELVYV